MKKSTLSFLAILSILLTSCSNNNYDDYDYYEDYVTTFSLNVDNGVDTTVNVTLTGIDIDTMFQIEVGGIGLGQLEVVEGKYKVDAVTCHDSVIVDGETIELSGENSYMYKYNLNLTKQDYIVENITYTVGAEDPDLLAGTKQFTYDGETYDGIDAYVIPGELLVQSDWEYNLDTEAPDEVTIYGGSNSTTKRKLYRASTFMLFLKLYEIFGGLDDEDSEESLW